MISASELHSLVNEGGGQMYTSVVPQSFTHASVTWVFSQENYVSLGEYEASTQSTTRHIITVERLSGCKAEPIIKFKVPLKRVPRDECYVEAQSQDTGATQSFPVKLCRGDLLRASITLVSEPLCPVDPCKPPCDVVVETPTCGSSFTAIINVFLW